MDDATVQLLAKALLSARDAGQVTSPPSSCVEGLSLDDGYRIGRRLHQNLIERGYKPKGRKIGFTNEMTWKEFGINTPIWAYMYDKSIVEAGSKRAEISLDGMTAPRLEPEIVIKFRQDVEPAAFRERILSTLDWVAIGFEIVDCHFPEWKMTAGDAVADFGVHRMLVVGEPMIVHNYDPRVIEGQLINCTVTLKKDGVTVAEGQGRNALGSPLLALKHVIDVVDRQEWAEPVAGGEIITTGTLTPLPYIKPGETWSVETAGIDLSKLEIALS